MAELGEVGFVLYGGTAVALRLGHRASIDFDLFSSRPIDRPALRRILPVLAEASVLQDEADALTVVVGGPFDAGGVKLSFFGRIDFGRVGRPERLDGDGPPVASLLDLLATKLKVLMQRIEAKDYRDVAAMISNGVSLPEGLSAAALLFAPTFQPSECLRALVYFEGGDLEELGADERRQLILAAESVGDLPSVQRLSRDLSP